ncbi:urea ABC transporter ATP-binding subunit UrtE [Phycisphaerales bacterium AB-hyl4]|uniref:Urea ABC transporter ATP-binding subunit UrtE n=1 Tax=Natronomicrosphaera hydrolytica TaxID=3242702 RepID=A0ABV4U9F8_9BACT
MLNITNLNFAYGSVQALTDIELTIPKAEITCIMGRNGVGKTTLLQNLMGVLRPASGSIEMDGKNMARWPAHKRVYAGLGLVPQGRHIFPKLTVEENLRIGLQGRTDGQRRIPENIYDLFPVLKQMSHRRGGDLSGGQQQQLAIGRALAGDPKVLLLDEPTEGIQPNIIHHIGKVLQQLVSDMQMTVILVEQYLDFVRDIGQRVYILDAGQVVAQTQAGEISQEMISRHLSV